MGEMQEAKAIRSMVLGLLSLPVPFIGWLLGVIAFSYARSAMEGMAVENTKRWFAVTGMVCGILGVVMDIGIALIAIIIFIFL